MIQKFVALWLATGLASALKCPDGSVCSDEATCCKKVGGGYSCCPLPEAVCCSDLLHCCPADSICDLARSACIQGLSRVPWVKKIPAIHTETTMWEEAKAIPLVQAGTPNAVTENICLDNAECPPEYTCMPTSKGFYGCCPLTEATICKDWEHCCPKGYECDLIEAKCKSTGVKEEKLPLVSGVGNLRAAESELCGNMSCSVGYTCCTSKDFGWGCCPMKDAVCCEDNSCCPKNFKCDKAKKTCIKPIDKNVKAIICPDGASECPDGSTCCLLADQRWGCCPLQEAVCCEDHLHCCPSETKCDLKQSKCVSKYGMMEMWKKFPAHRRFAMRDTKVQVVQCNGTEACPDNNTCCKLASGDFGCCPIPEAVCCDDHVHCCPNGYKCDPDTGDCYAKDISIPWMTKTPAIVQGTVKNVQCNETVSCPDDNTCCKIASGEWACCPIPQAVCCDDHVHCCPNGYKCDPDTGDCYEKDISIPWMTKTPAIVQGTVKNVQCNETVSCPDDNTCCKIASGEWACCPIPQAVCCDDHVHCCPNGYKCDPDTGDCYEKDISIPWMTKTPAIVQGTVKNVQCNETVSCPEDNTCCKTASGEWACCPIPQAVCCDDHVHCCPNGYKCDPDTGDCYEKDISIPWMTKTPAIVQGTVKNVQCNETVSCPEDNTCCKTASGEWACCPIPQAVCCEDHIHCCPNGCICDVQAGLCHMCSISIPLVTKAPTIVKSEALAVHCDDIKSCPSGNTCCRTASGQWACCPFPQAVCCKDKVHCCPNGYTCDVEHGACLKNTISFSWTTNKAASMKSLEKSRALDTKCNDSVSCPTGSTCCQRLSGDWGCCHLTEAVCCEDHEHCCPHGYICNIGAGTCEKESLSVPWEVKQSSLADVKCEDTSHCQSPATCCKIASGVWACCPYKEATCCEDQLHCCPNGYICNAAAKACTLRPQLRSDIFFPKWKKAFTTL